jgi:ABC-type nitrate/sulfonate/bicarbonate transport system permease component
VAKGAPAVFAGFRRPRAQSPVLAAGARARAASQVLIYLRTMAAFLIVWALVAQITGNPVLLPSPLAVFGAIAGLASDLELFLHAGISFARMVASLIVGSLLAIPLGLAMGRSKLLDRIVDPTIEILRPISGIAWIPLALFIFGIGNALPIFIMTYAGFFPILLGTIAGVRSVDRRLIDAARTMGVPERTIVTRVVMPAALPSLMVALRLGVAASWTAVVAAELIGAPSGLGYAVEWYRELLMTPQVMAFIAMIGLLGYLCDLGVRALGRALTPWATT